MGQISLIRLEKINTSMKWESSVFYDYERWAGLKLLMFNNLFAHYILKKKNIFFYSFWFKKLNNLVLSSYAISGKKKQNTKYLKNKFTAIKFSNEKYTTLTILGNYIYNYQNSYTSLIVYSNHKKINNTIEDIKNIAESY